MSSKHHDAADYAAGQQAGFDGFDACDNPHPSGSRKHDAWYAGWLDAEATRQEWLDLCGGAAA